MMKSKSALYIVLLFLFPVFALAQNIGEPAPDFTVTTVGGETFTLSEQSGKLVVIFFFGNSCPSCIGIAPTVEEDIYQAFNSNNNFTMIGIDTWDNSSSVSSVNVFKSGTGVTFDLVAKGGNIASLYSTTYDRLLVIDANGVLVHKGTQNVSADLNNAVAAIEENISDGATAIFNNKEDFVKGVYPNPTNGEINLDINLTEPTRVTFELYAITGKRILSRDLGIKSPGKHSAQIDLKEMNNGLYIYRVVSNGLSQAMGKVTINK